jgi:hypothetical protein
MIENLTIGAQKVLKLAQHEAQRSGAPEVRVEHLLLALVREVNGGVARILRERGVRGDALLYELSPVVAHSGDPHERVVPLAKETHEALSAAAQLASEFHHELVDTDHLFYGVLRVVPRPIRDVLENAGLGFDAVREIVRAHKHRTPIPLLNPLFLKKKRLDLSEEVLVKITRTPSEPAKPASPPEPSEPLACPRGHGPMDRLVRDGVRLAVCPECLSTFFEPGQLDALVGKLFELSVSKALFKAPGLADFESVLRQLSKRGAERMRELLRRFLDPDVPPQGSGTEPT